jgi:hypothetical protein
MQADAAQVRSERRAARDAELPTLRVVAIVTLLGAEVIHTATMEHHWRSWAAAGMFFLALSVVEGLLAAALYVGVSQRVALIGIGLSLATASLWVVSRVWGLPFGPFAGVPETVGVGDSISTCLELLTAVALLPFLRAPESQADGGHLGWPRAEATVAIVLVAAVLAGIGATSALRIHDHAHGIGAPASRIVAPR